MTRPLPPARPAATMLQLRPLAELLAETNPQLVRLLEHCRQQPEHLQPRTWTEGDRATARRILADQLAEPLADYGPALVLDALHSALVVDMVDMLPHATGETAAHLTRLADALQALAQAADLHEASHAR